MNRTLFGNTTTNLQFNMTAVKGRFYAMTASNSVNIYVTAKS